MVDGPHEDEVTGLIVPPYDGVDWAACAACAGQYCAPEIESVDGIGSEP